MKLHNAELRRMLAAEYALGTLRGLARRRLEKLAAADPGLRAEIHFWEARLDQLADSVKPVSPPERVWIGLQKRISTGNTVTLRRPAPDLAVREAKPSGPPIWRIAAGFAVAASVVVAVLMNRPHAPATIPTTPVVATAPVVAPPAAASYVALLKMPDSDMQWTVSLTPAHKRMTASVTGSLPAALNGRSAELWWLSANGPVAIGVLPVDGDGSMPLPTTLTEGNEVKLAISLEPPGGSPTGAPTGPVVTSAIAVRMA